MPSRKSIQSPSPNAETAQVESRLAALEAQVAELMATAAAKPPHETAANPKAGQTGDASIVWPNPAKASVLPQRKFWAIDGVLRKAEASQNDAGGVVFAGQVVLPNEETYAWQLENDTGDILAADWSVAHATLAALAHPIRLLVLKALIEGKRDTQSLASLPDMGTTGQLYHHLKELEAAGWIRQPRRGEYIVLAERVIPLLAILSACEVTQR